MTGKLTVVDNPNRYNPNDHRTVIPWEERRAGPKTKYRESVPMDVYKVLADGKSMEQAAQTIGVAVQTLYTWSKDYPELLEAIKQGKEAGREYWDLMATESCYDDSGVKLGAGYLMKMRNQYGMMTRDPDKTDENQANFMEALKTIRSGGKVTKDEWKDQFGKKSGE